MTNFEKALQACEAQNFTLALELFEKSILQNPQHAESFYNRALVYRSTEIYDKSIQDFNIALQFIAPNPANKAMILGERAVSKHLANDNLGAMKDFDEAVILEPQNPYRYASRAYIKSILGDMEGAIVDYNVALKLDPEDAVSYNNLGLIEEKLGRKEKAKRNFEKADQIADAGKTFEKPNIEELVKNYEKQQAEIKESLAMQNPEPKKPSLNDYFKVVTDVFTKKETRQKFWDFISRKNKSNQNSK